MLSSIHPLGERGRNSRYTLTLSAYVVGSALGGLAIGTASGAVGHVARMVVEPSATALAVIVAVVAGAGVLMDLRVGRLRVPSYHRQVNEDWLNRYRGWVYGGGFGLQLGLAFVTIVPSASIYATFLLAALSGSVATGALVGLTFGLVRSSMVLSMARVHTPDALRIAHQRLAKAGPVAHRLAVGAQAAVGLFVVGVLAWL